MDLRRIAVAVIGGGVILLVSATSSFSDGKATDGDSFYFLDTSVVTPSRYAEPLLSASSTVMVISHQAIRERGYRDLVDVLEDLPGFDIQRRIGGQDGGSYVIGRGLWGNNKIQVLMDGVPINPQNGTHLVYGRHISVDGLERIEVMYGPGSAVYGANAFAGVINLITRSPKSGKVSGEARLQGGKHDTVLGHLLLEKRFGDRGDAHLYFNGYRSTGFDMRREYQEYTIDNGFGVETPIYNPDMPYETPEQDYDMRFKAHLGGWELMLMYWYTRQPNNIQTPYYTGRTQMEKDKAELRTFDGVLRNTLDLGGRFTLESEWLWQFYELDPTSDYGRLTFDNYVYERSRSFRWEERGRYSLGEDVVTGGVSVQRVSAFPYINTREPFDRGDEVEKCIVDAIGFPSGLVVSGVKREEEDYWNYGIYGEFFHWFAKDLNLRVGVRYDWTTLTSTSSLNPRISLTYLLDPRQRIRLSYGTAYISPSLYFLKKAWVGSTIVHLPPDLLGEDLESEKVQSWELAYSLTSERFVIDISAYYNYVRDLIIESAGREEGFSVYFENGSEARDVVAEFPKNAGSQTSVGVDVMAKYRFSRLWSFYLYYSYVNDRIDLAGGEFDAPKVSNHKAGGGITGLLLGGLTCHLRFRWWSGINTTPMNPLYEGGRIKGYMVLDAALRWSNLFTRGLDLVVTINNLLNTEYFTAGSQSEDHRAGASLPKIPQEPREVLLGLEYRF